jgi:hypothetical protein
MTRQCAFEIIALTTVLAASFEVRPSHAEDVYFETYDSRPSYLMIDSYTDPNRTGWRDWSTLNNGTSVATSSIGATTGTQSLAWQPGLVGYNQGLTIKFQQMPLSLEERNAFIEGMLANTHVALNVTWDNAEWAAQYTGSGWNGSQLFDMVFSYGPGGAFQGQSFPDIDTGNPGLTGHWDLASYPGVHTRTVMWDYSAHKTTLQSLYTAGTMNGQNGWLELMLTTNAGNFNYPITYYIDSWRFTTPAAGLLGDFNEDGTVDAADYVIYRKNEGTTNTLPNDNGIGGTVGAAHYELWRANFGNANAGAGASAPGAVPEPAAWLLGILGAGLVGLCRRR